MKYSQFIELDEILNENGHSLKEFNSVLSKDFTDNQLYEFFGINKALLSWGVKGILAKRLKKQAERFTSDSEKIIINSIRKIIQAKNKVKNQIKVLKDANKPIPEKAFEQIILMEKKIIKGVNDTIDELASIKTQQIDQKIDNSKKLKASAKLGLKYLWVKLISESKVNTLTKMMEQKIIESAESVKLLKGAFEKEDEKLKAKAKKVDAEIKKETGSKEGEKKTVDDEGGAKKGEEL